MTTLRVFGIVTGTFLLTPALACYEDEERKIQSRIEESWILLSDMIEPSYKRHNEIARSIIHFVNGIIDSLFGSAFLSWRFLAVSLTISALFSLFSPEGVGGELAFNDNDMGRIDLSIVLLTAIVLVALLWNARRSKGWSVLSAALALPTAITCLAGLRYIDGQQFSGTFLDWLEGSAAIVLPAGLLSLAGDLSAVWLFRKQSARAFTGTFGGWFVAFSSTCIALVGVALPAAFVVLVSHLFFLGDSLGGGLYDASFIWQIAAMDAGDVMVFFIIVLIAMSVVIHHSIWPLMLRALYAVQRIGFTRIRIACWGLGLALIGSSLTPSGDLTAFWDALRKALGG